MRLVGNGLAAERGGRPVFAGVSFAVGAGGLLAVTGPNGSGKSTMLRLVAGLLRPSAGSVALDPEPEEGTGSAIHYLGHLDGLKLGLSLADNLAFWRRLWGGNGLPVEAALELVGIARLADLPVAVLSAGQRRRAAISRLFLAERPVWLLDEPTTALDTDAEATLGALIARHLAGGGIAVAATHRSLPVAPTATLSLGQGA